MRREHRKRDEQSQLPRLQRQEQIRRPRPADANVRQHRIVSDIREVKCEQLGGHDAEKEQHERPLRNAQTDSSRGEPTRGLSCEGERPRHAGQEQEQRKDGVVLAQSVPRNVRHLLCKPAVAAESGHLARGHDHRREPHDPDHVRPAQRVERPQPFLLFCHGLVDDYDCPRRDEHDRASGRRRTPSTAADAVDVHGP